jgi:hypothetical protein
MARVLREPLGILDVGLPTSEGLHVTRINQPDHHRLPQEVVHGLPIGSRGFQANVRKYLLRQATPEGHVNPRLTSETYAFPGVPASTGRDLVANRHHRRVFMELDPRPVKHFHLHVRLLSTRLAALGPETRILFRVRGKASNNAGCPRRSRSNYYADA